MVLTHRLRKHIHVLSATTANVLFAVANHIVEIRKTQRRCVVIAIVLCVLLFNAFGDFRSSSFYLLFVSIFINIALDLT